MGQLPILISMNICPERAEVIVAEAVAVAVNRWQEAGTHSVVWDATDVPSGIYFVKIVSGEFRQVRKVMVLR